MLLKRILWLIIVVSLFLTVILFQRWRAVDRWTKNNQISSQTKSPMDKKETLKSYNHLKDEKSPYLLQHADNPVHWHPWSEEAFNRAKQEDKPVFLSIGYSTCHWCHVMEHESFENQEIANILNKYFVSIKVDREERPDVDNIYMSAVMNLTGSGGWPLSVFLTPDKKPFFGGTYFPPESRWGSPGFKEILISTSDQWQNNREKVLKVGDVLTERIADQSDTEPSQTSLNKDTLEQAYIGFAREFDNVYGGFGSQPKFPTSHNLSFLLRYWKRTGETKVLSIVEKTLIEMAKGGMYDHVGGGFHRYSTDRKWHVPHFEKMLYDQAILSKTYLEAYQATKKERYAQTAREIFDYVLRDMRDKDGGFYSAEDADSIPPEDFVNMTPDPTKKHEKKEGAFYLWTQEEIIEALGKEDADIFNYYYGVEKNGNADFDPHGEFIGKNILFVAHNAYETAQQFKRDESEIKQIIERAKQKLFSLRNERPRPHLDDKTMVDWNGLMISSLAFGSRVLDDPKYLAAAESSAQFILKNLMTSDGRLLHRYRDGEAGIMATLEDYAFFVHGLIDLYEATFKPEYLKEAKRLTEDMLKLFWDDNEQGFFFTADDSEKLLVRTKEIYDGAIPSGNSIAALNLIRLAHLTLEVQWEEKTSQLMKTFADQVRSRPNAYGQLMTALDYAIGPSNEIAIAGNDDDPKTKEMVNILFNHFLPNKVVIYRPISDDEAKDIIALVPFVKNQKSFNNETTVYVCTNYQCKKPTSNIGEFKSFLNIK